MIFDHPYNADSVRDISKWVESLIDSQIIRYDTLTTCLLGAAGSGTVRERGHGLLAQAEAGCAWKTSRWFGR